MKSQITKPKIQISSKAQNPKVWSFGHWNLFARSQRRSLRWRAGNLFFGSWNFNNKNQVSNFKFQISNFLLPGKRNGFTFLELMIALAISVIMSAFILVFLNAPKQLEKARNTRRTADINSIINAIGQNSADHRGIFICSAGAIPASSTRMAIGAANYNVASCLVPAYIASMPYDPNAFNAHWATTTDYDTAYGIARSATTGRITISAIYPESGENISVTR